MFHSYNYRDLHIIQSCTAANAQTVIDLQVTGGTRVGYIEATVQFRNGTTVTGPVCGSVDSGTATLACYSKELFGSSAQGTVAGIG